MGYSPKTYAKHRSGGTRPPGMLLERVVSVHGASPAWLLTGEGPMLRPEAGAAGGGVQELDRAQGEGAELARLAARVEELEDNLQVYRAELARQTAEVTRLAGDLAEAHRRADRWWRLYRRVAEGGEAAVLNDQGDAEPEAPPEAASAAGSSTGPRGRGSE